MIRHIAAGMCIGLASANVVATPRALLAEESQVDFVVKEMGVPVPGKFTRFEAVIDMDSANPEKSNVNMRIEIASLTTGNDEADALATGSDWLDKTQAPFASFQSKTIRPLSAGKFEATGTLSIRNKPRDIVLQFEQIDQPGGRTIVAGGFVIRRSDFGIGGGVWNEGGVVGEEIPVKLRLTLAPASAARK